MMLGVGVGGAVSAYLGVAMRSVDPAIPFALSSMTLFATTWGLIWIERALMRSEQDHPGASDSAAPAPVRPRLLTASNAAFLLSAVLLGLGYQVHVFFNAVPQYLRYASNAELDHLLPIFWIGFNLLSLPLAALTPRWGGTRILLLAAALGAIGSVIAGLAPSLTATIVGQLLIGGAWGTVMFAGLATAFELGRTGREGATSGLWFSTQSLAAFLRLGIVVTQLHHVPDFTIATAWIAPGIWLMAALLLAGLLLRLASWQRSMATKL
jgi:hypothetical protein